MPKNKRKIWSLFVPLIILIFALAFISGCASKEKEEGVIKIGATFPLTGPFSLYGEAYKNGALLAQTEINSVGGINGKKLKVEIMDNKGDTKTAVSDVNYLINIENVPVILNSFEYLTLATKDITEKAKKVMLSFTTYRLASKDNPVYTFRDYWDLGKIGTLFGKAANKIGSKKVGIIAQTDSSYVYFKEGFVENYDGEIVTEQKFLYGEKDFKTELLKIKSKDIDTIVVYAFPAEANQILKQLYELGMDNYKLIITEGSESFVTAGNEEILQKTNAISYLGAELSAENAEFISKYKEVYGSHPRPDAFFVYEDVKMIAEALKKCNNNADCIKDDIANNFDENQNKFRELPLIQYDNGWKEYKI